MSDKTARKFQKLLDAHKEAVDTRKTASKAARAIRGLDGDSYSLSALGSKAGAKALDAEIEALRAERRALKRLAAFASGHVSAEAPARDVETDDEAKTSKARTSKAKTSKAKTSKAKTSEGKASKGKKATRKRKAEASA